MLTVTQLVEQIETLGERPLAYASGNSTLRITRLVKPEGPVIFTAEGRESVGRVSIPMLAKIVSLSNTHPNYRLHIDRVFSAGGNSRSALETILLHLPHFFLCYPQRIDVYSGETISNLKHLMWCPDDEHDLGWTDPKMVDTEIVR